MYIQEYLDKNLLSCRTKSIGSDNYEIYCYTKNAFYGNQWDDVTLSHRGQIYKNGVALNHPFPKIFNVDEHPSTEHSLVASRLQSEPFEVYDKVNGHLVIVSTDTASNNILVSTKGSLHSEMVTKDTEILNQMGILSALRDVTFLKYANITLMFECIAPYDKHTLYEQQAKLYGSETMVLLGVVLNDGSELAYDELVQIANSFNCPVVKRYDNLGSNFSDWYSHKDIEGYVIRFLSDNYRVKIKTTEYWAIRIAKSFRMKSLMDIYRSGGFLRLRHRLPEELMIALPCVYDIIAKYLDHMYSYIQPQHLQLSGKKLYTHPDLSSITKTLIQNYSKYCDLDQRTELIERLSTSATFRNTLIASPFTAEVIAEYDKDDNFSNYLLSNTRKPERS